MSLISQAATNYQYFATNKPLLTNSVTGFLIASFGDVVCQKVLSTFEKRKVLQDIKKSELLSNKVESGLNNDTNKSKNIFNKKQNMITNDSQNNGFQTTTSTPKIERNVLKNVLFRNRIKKTNPDIKPSATNIQNKFDKNIVGSNTAVKNGNENEQWEWDKIRTFHLGLIRACKLLDM